MKIAVIGAGISGISVAKMLANKHDVHVFEQSDQIGGLIKCERNEEGLFHKVGGHVFNSKSIEVLDWFWSHFNQEHEFTKVKRNAKVLFDGKIIGYPIENYLYMLDKTTISKIIQEVINLQPRIKESPFLYSNFESFLRGNFGDTLFELYFQPYNKKLWRVDLSTVSMQWLEGKLPMPNLQEMLLSNILKEEETSMVHSTFFYPKYGGSQFIIDRLSKGLNIKVGEKISDITLKNDKYLIGEENYDKIVYTGDVRSLPKSAQTLLVMHGFDVEELKKLRSNGTSNLFCHTDATDISWLYIPEDFTKAHRIIYTGNFSRSNNNGDRTTCVVEFSGQVSRETMEKEIMKLPGNLKSITHNYEPNSYIIHDSETRAMMNNVKSILERSNIYLLGRFAEWEYYNMDKCIEKSFAIVNSIEGT